MKCARCGDCCKGTSMELSEEDIRRLVDSGFARDHICIIDDDGLARLRNVDGRCVFLSPEGRICTVYAIRPLGCDIYPVNCDQEGGIFVDEFCRSGGTVSKQELNRKGIALKKHLATIDGEAKARKQKGPTPRPGP